MPDDSALTASRTVVIFINTVYCDSELTMGHGTNGSTDLDWSRGPWDPLTDD